MSGLQQEFNSGRGKRAILFTARWLRSLYDPEMAVTVWSGLLRWLVFFLFHLFTRLLILDLTPALLIYLWHVKAPSRVVAFGCVSLLWSILDVDNGLPFNVCPMCLQDVELVDHLLLNCKTGLHLWNFL